MRCKLSWLSNCFLILMHHWIHLHVPSILWQIIVNFTVHEDYITFGDRDAWGLLSLLSGLTRLKIASTNQRKFQMFPSQTNPCLISLEFGLRRAWIVEQFFNQWFLLTQKHMKAKNDLERGRERKRERERGKGKRMEERKREWERKKGKKNERTREGERDSGCISGCQIHVVDSATKALVDLGSHEKCPSGTYWNIFNYNEFKIHRIRNLQRRKDVLNSSYEDKP